MELQQIFKALDLAEGLTIEELELMRFALAIRIIVRRLQNRA